MHQRFSAGSSFPGPRARSPSRTPPLPAKPTDAGERRGAGSAPEPGGKGWQRFHNPRGRRRLTQLPPALGQPLPFLGDPTRRRTFSGDIQDPPGQGPLQPAAGDPASAGGLD